MTAAPLPLAGLRVLDYGQYVAGPFATMLLADLGADVVKVEPPRGDEWRRYDPFEEGESRYFYALNRGKRSVVLDLKSEDGPRAQPRADRRRGRARAQLPARSARAASASTATSVHAVNPRCVTVCVSAFGSSGPDAERPAYDLIGQALSGLLLADPRSGDPVPRRTGGLALADFTAGLLAALSVAAGLLGRGEQRCRGRGVAARRRARAPGAALRGGGRPRRPARRLPFADASDLERLAGQVESLEALDPYYRAHACADGFVALACLNAEQRRQVCELLGLEDPFADEPAGRARRRAPSASAAPRTCGRSRRASRASA